MSLTTLQNGVTYKIRGCGTVALANDGRPDDGDAEYQFEPTPDHMPANNVPPNCVDVGIGINDTVNDASKFPSWGAFSPTHNYTINFIGLGAPIGLDFHDCFGDNVGSLTVLIFPRYRFRSRSAPSLRVRRQAECSSAGAPPRRSARSGSTSTGK